MDIDIEDIDIEDIRCGACGTVGACVPLGDMGSLMWYRCKACGMDVSIKKTQEKKQGKIRSSWKLPPSTSLGDHKRENPEVRIHTKHHPLSMERGWPS